jgi:hypothetical protein
VRAAGLVLFFAGLVLALAGSFLGCGALFSWNGRHAVTTQDLLPGTPLRQPLSPEAGRRYTVSVQVLLSAERNVKMPVVASAAATGAGGEPLFDAKGWVDPAEPNTLVFGDAPPIAERMLGTFVARTPDPVQIAVDLGPDRGGASVEGARLVVYDDALPPQIRRAFAMAGAGALGVVAGIALLVAGFFRRRKRSGIRKRPVV